MLRQADVQGSGAASRSQQIRVFHQDFHRKAAGFRVCRTGDKADHTRHGGAIQQFDLHRLPGLDRRHRLLGNLPGGFQAINLNQLEQGRAHLYQCTGVYFPTIHYRIKGSGRFEVLQRQFCGSQLGLGGCQFTLQPQHFGFGSQVIRTQPASAGKVGFQLADIGSPALNHGLPAIG